MKNKNELLKYLLGRFFLTIIFIWIFQGMINLAMESFIIPLMEKMLGLDGILSGNSLAGTMNIFFSSLIITLIRITIGSGGFERVLSEGLIGRILLHNQKDALILINEQVESQRLVGYALSVLFLFFVLLVIWSLPYILGAFIYAKRVYKKVNELEKMRIEREKEFEKQRNLLLSDVTHDIKTPITTIAGFSRALADGTVPDSDREEYLHSIYNKSMTVSQLVELLFEYIKLDSKGYSLNLDTVDLAEIVRECTALYYADFENKNMEIVIDIPETEIWISADKMQLERAINNILSNTLVHNPEGTPIGILLKKVNQMAVLNISDKGVKIDIEDAKHLFEPFYRGDKSRQSGKGNGLGLSITKKIIDMHGGKVVLRQYADSDRYDKVKEFEIMLPLAHITTKK